MSNSAHPPKLDSLARAERAFLKRLVEERPNVLAARGIAGHVARTSGLGSISDGWIAFTRQDFERAGLLLRSATAPSGAIEAVSSGTGEEHARRPGGRPGRPRVPAVEVAKPPFDIAVLPLGSSVGPTPFPQHFIATDVRAPALRDFPILVACDTLDVMAHLPRFTWLLEDFGDRPALAFYRGDSGRFREKTASSLVQACTDSEVWFAGDFQPRVLFAAARIPRLSRLCYPDVVAIEQIPAHVAMPNGTSLLRHYSLKLGEAQPEPIASSWKAMSRVGRCFYLRDFPCGARSEARRSAPASR